MLAYAQSRQRIGERGSSPSTMLLIVGIHIAEVAVAMSMKMVVDRELPEPPIEIELIKEKLPPPKRIKPEPRPKSEPAISTLDRPITIVPRPGPPDETDSRTTLFSPTGELAGGVEIPKLPFVGPIIIEPVRTGPRLNTPESALKPPYPASKLDSQQEAKLRLQLSIDERGRVTAVQPVGSVDRAFFEAARRHLIARWRYRPATVDGSAVPSSTTITLRFELEG